MLLKFIEDARVAIVLQHCARILLAKALDSTLPACVQRSLSTRPSDAVRDKPVASFPLITQVRANQNASKHAAVSNGGHCFIAHGVRVTAPLSFLYQLVKVHFHDSWRESGAARSVKTETIVNMPKHEKM